MALHSRKHKENNKKSFDFAQKWRERKKKRNVQKKQVWIPGIGIPNNENVVYVPGFWERIDESSSTN